MKFYHDYMADANPKGLEYCQKVGKILVENDGIMTEEELIAILYPNDDYEDVVVKFRNDLLIISCLAHTKIYCRQLFKIPELNEARFDEKLTPLQRYLSPYSEVIYLADQRFKDVILYAYKRGYYVINMNAEIKIGQINVYPVPEDDYTIMDVIEEKLYDDDKWNEWIERMNAIGFIDKEEERDEDAEVIGATKEIENEDPSGFITRQFSMYPTSPAIEELHQKMR